jgi:hypothetical protein
MSSKSDRVVEYILVEARWKTDGEEGRWWGIVKRAYVIVVGRL